VPTESTDQIHSIAEILAVAYPDAAVRQLLAEHIADASGHCSGCRSATSASPVWPCRLWEIGKESERLKLRSRAAGVAVTSR
jgi:hypothetical protein